MQSLYDAGYERIEQFKSIDEIIDPSLEEISTNLKRNAKEFFKYKELEHESGFKITNINMRIIVFKTSLCNQPEAKIIIANNNWIKRISAIVVKSIDATTEQEIDEEYLYFTDKGLYYDNKFVNTKRGISKAIEYAMVKQLNNN